MRTDSTKLVSSTAMAVMMLPLAAVAQTGDGNSGRTVAAEDSRLAADRGDDIVVTAIGLPSRRDEAGQAISVIDAGTIDRQQTLDIATLLSVNMPSVRINRTGSTGAVTGVSLRGAETTQTLVLLDGVRINDPSAVGDGVDFGNLLTANVRRIEVLRGSNSVAYGSQAIGGVVNIVTGEAPGEGFTARASGEYGYADTVNGKANVAYADETITANAGYSYFRTDGISSAAPQFGATERDGLDNHTANAKVNVRLADGLSVDLRGYFIDARLDYDSFFAGPADSPDVSRSRQYIAYAGINADLLDGRFTNVFSTTYLDADRDYFFAPSDEPDFGYRGKTWRFEYRGAFQATEAIRLLLGYAHDAPRYRFSGFGSSERHSNDTDDVYAMAVVQPVTGLTISGGLRHQWHSQFGEVTTLGANANWGLGDGSTRIRASYGEGFKAPSLYELYDSFYGNAALRPERSRSYDAGIDKDILGGRVTLSATAFERRIRNQIAANAFFVAENIARTRARGVELTADLRPTDTLTVQTAYSYIDARDRSPGANFDQRLRRRPANSISVSVDQAWSFGLSTGATLTMAGDARDGTVAAPRNLDGYALLGLRAEIALGQNLSLYGRVDNVFDETYATAFGYGTYGRSAFVGVRTKL